MSCYPDEQWLPSSPQSFRIQGGATAPARARDHVRSYLDPDESGTCAFDAVLIASELVTNSVLHANVDTRGTLSLDLATLGDHLRIAVTDAGSLRRPRLLPARPGRPGGMGLRMVDQLSSAWGVERDAVGATCVWCDLPLGD